MDERPKIKLTLTATDWLIETIGWMGILSVWFFVLTSYKALPETIPTHFNGAGEADGFGEKASVLALPAIVTVIFIVITFLSRFPHILNYPVAITQENAVKQYTIATRMMRYLKTMLVFVFAFIAFKTIQVALGKAEGMGKWFIPVVIAIVFITITIFIINAVRNQNKD